MQADKTKSDFLDSVVKFTLKFMWYLIIIPLAICAIPFVIIGWLGVDQIAQCIAEKSQKRRR